MDDIRIAQCEQKIKEKGIKLIGKKVLASGEQWILESDRYELLKLNIYSSKKGVSYVLSDKKVSIYSAVNEIMTQAFRTCMDPELCYVGTDESGKGDYFGPLVTAGFVSDGEMDAVLIRNGIRDSKQISDANVRGIADWLKQSYPDRCAILEMEPWQYNERYGKLLAEGKKSNAMLAQSHSVIIQSLIKKHPGIRLVITDQFSDKILLGDIGEGNVACRMETKAEKYAAVAAASILARDTYLKWMEKTSRKLGFELPKGCGENVKFAADRMISGMGRMELPNYAKIHFRTTNEILSGTA